MGHAMMLDNGWEKVADRLIAWLAAAPVRHAACGLPAT
jgi:hypothetical protein